MNKKKFAVLLAVSAMGAGALMACNPAKEELSDAPEFKKVILSDLTAGKPAGWAVSDGWTNGTPFGVEWSNKQAKFDENGMTFSISKDAEGKYYGGEIKTIGEDGVFKYGYYGARMKPSNAVGTVSSFFTYTGPTEDNPHDEIDIEFLGKDTTEVQFNYYAESDKSHEFKYKLGFDASKDFHDYGFYWDDKQIVWYVDGVAVHRVKESIPSLGQRIMTNYWKGDDTKNITNWMGAYDDKNLESTQSEYKAIYYADLEGKGRVFETGPSTEDGTPIELSFNSAEEYVVTNGEDHHSADVTYEGVTQSYHNIVSALPAEAASKNIFSTKIKNLGSEASIVRININSDKAHGENNIYAINTKGSIEGRGEVNTDLSWGGTYFTVEPNEEITAVVEYAGKPNNVELMIDSTRSDGPHSGHVLFSDYKLGGSQTVNPDDNPEDPDPVDPSDDEAFDPTIVEGALPLTFSTSSGYTVTGVKENKAAEVSYTDLEANYQTVWADLPADAATKNTFTAKVKNLRATTVNVRVNVTAEETHGAHDITVINTRGYYTGASTDVRTDLEWGGSFFEVAAGAEIELNVVYEGNAKKVEFMFDSSKVPGTYSGHLGISNFRLSGEQSASTGEETGGETGGEISQKVALSSKFVGNDNYTVADGEDGQSVSWANIGGSSYLNIQNSVVASEIEGASAIELVVQNTSEELLKGRVDLMSWEPETHHEKSHVAGEGIASAYTDLQWGGTSYSIEAGQTGTITVNFEGNFQTILMYFNSSTYDDVGTHSGSALIKSVSAIR
ncbi:MAG: family 16 glycosylhydrolase [Candidatus Enteromonas sp.]